MRYRGLEPNLYYEMSRLELAARCVGVACAILLIGLIWIAMFAFHETEAAKKLWREETVSKIELWTPDGR